MLDKMVEAGNAAPADQNMVSNMFKISQIRNKTRAQSKEFSVATFNVRGLTQDLKKVNLATDLDRYNVDVCCLQETKIKDGIDCNISSQSSKNSHRLICFPTKSEHYGMGFMIHEKWIKLVHKAWTVNDRIAVLQIKSEQNKQKEDNQIKVAKGEGLKLTFKNIKQKVFNRYRTFRRKLKIKFMKVKPQERHLITIINVYGPHSEITKKKPEERDQLYKKLDEVIDSTRKGTSLMIIAGDFNSEVGRRNDDDTCIGRYSSGERNENGQSMINFCEANDLLLSNTCFQHPQRHITTWEQTRTMKQTNKTTTIRKMLDYITIDKKQRHILKNSRSFQGTLTNSDHRIVVTRMIIEWYEIYKKVNNKKTKSERYNTHILVNDKKKLEEYKRSVDEKLRNHREQKTWKVIVNTVKSAAKEVVGEQNPKVNKDEYSEKIEELSNEQKKIRIEISNTQNTEKIVELRKKRNKVIKEIKKELKSIRESNIDEIIKEIDDAPHDMKMYKSIKRLKAPTKKNNIIVHDDDGKRIINEKEKYQAIKEHFHHQLYDENAIKIEQFEGEPRPLVNKITVEEVNKSLKRMSNNRAAGEDGIPTELLKYGPQSLMEEIARILNCIFEEHLETINVGQSILVPIPKPGKTEGPKKNLRPINLLNVIRKVLSLITLNRINEPTDNHIQHSQAAYRANRSTADIVWAHRFICAKVQLYEDVEVTVVGIDMSSAFDTIQRKNLMDEFENILEEDERRMCRLLLSNTTITVKFGNHEPETVKTNVGSPQGDAISGKFYNVEFENALRPLREILNKSEPQIEHSYCMKSSLPTEMEYADDSDFPFESKQKAEVLKLNVKEILAERNLKVNEDKTEETIIKREKEKRNETWRKTRKLGSLLGDYEDMKRREQLSNGAMAGVRKIMKKSKAKVKKKVKIYKTLVKTVLTYNYGTWGLTKKETEELNVIHRKQLRRISPSHWRLSNKKLYEVCDEREISRDMQEARWRTFGHMLRLPILTPCQQAMQWYFEKPMRPKRYRGNQRITLPVMLHNDIVEANKVQNLEIEQFRCMNDLEKLRDIANDRRRWKEVTRVVCGVA